LFIEDARNRQALDRKLTAMRDQLERLDAELAAVPEMTPGYSAEQLEALTAWWDEFDKIAVSMPVKGDLPVITHFYQDPWAEEAALLVEPRKVNEALHQIGCEVRLRWETKEHVSLAGKPCKRHVLVRGRFRLGQHKGVLPRYVLEPSACRWRT